MEDGTEKYYAMRLGFKVMNNEAEYRAVLARLAIIETSGANKVEMKVDSLVVVDRVIGGYLTKE